ncbi:response regulator transcription factor [Cereibacter sediminicola]|uniref:response regulator transcription factor n=1 Tax=Cereibacter sediminicola TaxID=2584941 RepID=UPI0011AB27B2|nr:response regulator transcription factor [Cereibacter sediminicola]
MTQMPQKLSVLIADDHEMVVEMFSLFLTASSEMTVRTAKSLDEGLERIKEHGPFDVTLLDLNMPGMNGVAGLTRAIKLSAGKPVAILTSNPTPRMVDEILAAGASGIVLKTTPVRSLGNAIRFMHAGEHYLPLELARDRRQAPDSSGGRLTEKEMLVMSYLAEGRQNKEIAHGLNLAEPTIKMHVKSICKKLGATNRTQAVVTARNLGII